MNKDFLKSRANCMSRYPFAVHYFANLFPPTTITYIHNYEKYKDIYKYRKYASML